MAKKKQEDPPKGSPAWMATFSDLMNLLLCFFVLLFSMASVDAAKFEIVVNSLKSAFSVLNSGVFVDIGGVDGMVHISELSWSRIKNPAEVVSVGDTLDVYVISFDAEKHKISLGVKDRSANPWDKFMQTYHVGDVANVRIVKLMAFGAFAEVVPGVDGLIHISQIADHRIEKPGDVLSEGEMVDAKITAVDEEKQKISLSIRALLAPVEVEETAAEEVAEEAAPAEE